MSAVPLATATLGSLRYRLPLPGYDRAGVTAGVVHIGVGGFHRSHQAMYLDRLLASGKAAGWGICGVGVLPTDRQMRDVLSAQDCLYTLVVKHPDGTVQPRVIGSIVAYRFVPDDPGAVVEQVAAAETRLVTLTITEGGYGTAPGTGEPDPAVSADLAAGAEPRSAFGIVVEAIRRRHERRLPPLTILSCDNIEANGEVARRAFVGFAAARDPGLASLVAGETRFPSSMVDRITPRTTDADRAELARRFGVADRWPVVCEPFSQWVVEDDFAAGRPPLEEAGAQLVRDVGPYELMKLRLLNAGHQALAYAGSLLGYRSVDAAARDPLLAGFLLDYMRLEAIPSLQPVVRVDLDAYAHQLVERFSNAAIGDTLARLASDASERIPKFLLPVVRHQLASGGPIGRATAVVACWARYAEGADEQGAPLELDDRRGERLAAAARNGERPLAFLADNRDVFGDLADDPRFSGLFRCLRDALRRRGVRAVLGDLG